MWQGSLRLSLVSCPVALYSATSRTGDVSFHLLNPETNNRIRMIPTDPDTGPVERSDLVKGYEISKNHYVVLSNEELDAVRLETTKTIEIERFVDEKEIDRLYWKTLLSFAQRKGRRGSLYRDPRGAGGDGPHRAGPGGDAHPRTAGGAGAARQGHYLSIPCAWATKWCAQRGFCRIPAAQPDKQNDRDRPQDHRAAGRRLRAREIRGPL